MAIDIGLVGAVAPVPRRAVLTTLRSLCAALSGARAACEWMIAALEYSPPRSLRTLIYNSDVPIELQRPRRCARRCGNRIRCLRGALSALASITAVTSIMAVGAVITSLVASLLAFVTGAIAATAAVSIAAFGWALVLVLESVAENAISAHLRIFKMGPMRSACMVTGRLTHHQPKALRMLWPPPSPPPSPTEHARDANNDALTSPTQPAAPSAHPGSSSGEPTSLVDSVESKHGGYFARFRWPDGTPQMKA